MAGFQRRASGSGSGSSGTSSSSSGSSNDGDRRTGSTRSSSSGSSNTVGGGGRGPQLRRPDGGGGSDSSGSEGSSGSSGSDSGSSGSSGGNNTVGGGGRGPKVQRSGDGKDTSTDSGSSSNKSSSGGQNTVGGGGGGPQVQRPGGLESEHIQRKQREFRDRVSRMYGPGNARYERSRQREFAEGVAYSDRGLYKQSVRMDVENQLRDQGEDPDDFTIDVRGTSTGFEARARTQEQTFIDSATGGMYSEVSGYQSSLTADARSRLSDAGSKVSDGLLTPRTPEATAAADWTSGVVDRGVDTGKDVFTAATIIPRAAVGAGKKISDENLGKETVTGAAVVGVAAPEPVSTGAGLAVLGGVAVAGGVGYVSNELKVDDDPTPTSEVDVPKEDDLSELQVPNQGEVSELSAGDTPTVDVTELGVGGETSSDPTTLQAGELVQPGQENRIGEETPDEMFVNDGLEYIRDGDDIIITGERPPEFTNEREFPTGESSVVGRNTGTGEETTPENVGIKSGLEDNTVGQVETPGTESPTTDLLGAGQAGQGDFGSVGELVAPGLANPPGQSLSTPALLSTPSTSEYGDPTAISSPVEADAPAHEFAFDPTPGRRKKLKGFDLGGGDGLDLGESRAGDEQRYEFDALDLR